MRSFARRVRESRFRWLALPVVTYVALVLVGNGLILIGVAAARVAGHDPRTDLIGFPEVKHLRQVDHRVWAGAGPKQEDLGNLADIGITTVIDLREGVPGDVRGDEDFATMVGLDYVWIPLPDGQVIEDQELERLLAAVDDAEGGVYINCGGGVGRTTSTTAAYEAAVGRDPALWSRLAVGPMSLEQAWFIVSAEPSDPAPDHPVVEALSRYVVDAPRRAVNWVEVAL